MNHLSFSAESRDLLNVKSHCRKIGPGRTEVRIWTIFSVFVDEFEQFKSSEITKGYMGHFQ